MDTQQLRELIESPRAVTFWGSPYVVTPVFVEQPCGDGKALLGLQPLATRPNYYVVRVDSRWSLFSDHEADLPERLEQIYEAIEAEHGGEEEPEGWPALSTDCGVAWWPIRWREVLALEE